jgi:hypothetical protein
MRVSELDVTEKFGLRIPRRAWVVLLPAAAAIGLMFAPTWTTPISRANEALKPADPKAISRQTAALSKKIAGQRQNIDKQLYPEADKLLAEIQKKTEEMTKAPSSQKDKLMVELNKLTDALKDRQKQLGSPDQLNRQLQQLKELGEQGPADQLARELSRGDFQKAAEQLKALQQKLKSGQLSEPEKKALKDQLAEMSKKLNDLANMQERKKQLEEARKNGGLSQQQYEREMEKLAEQSKSLQKLQKLASQLGQAKDALEKGDPQKAAESLGMTQQQLAEMAQQLQELKTLDETMADVMDAKNGMTTDGMNQLGESMANLGMNPGRMGNNGQQGLGRGRGQGDRPEASDDTSTYTTRVNQQLNKGKAVFQGFGPMGKTVKGQSVIDIQGEIDAAGGLAADALSNQKIPRNVEKHIRAYYDQINKR